MPLQGKETPTFLEFFYTLRSINLFHVRAHRSCNIEKGYDNFIMIIIDDNFISLCKGYRQAVSI